MELNVKERLTLLDILPREGDYTTIRIVRELREQVSFSDEEHAAYDFQYTEDGRMTWNAEAVQSRDFLFAPKARHIIEEALVKADKAKKLTSDHVSVYEKFFPPEAYED
jgi:hypothetical protein